MTIIVYRDGIMASDRLLCADDLRATVGCRDKITVTKDGSLLGCTGSTAQAIQMERWAHKGAKGDFKDAGKVRGILVRRDGTIYHIDNFGVPVKIEAAYHAMGSCQDFAFGCLAAGKSAVETVELCIKHIPGIGGGVQVAQLSTAPKLSWWQRVGKWLP